MTGETWDVGTPGCLGPQGSQVRPWPCPAAVLSLSSGISDPQTTGSLLGRTPAQPTQCRTSALAPHWSTQEPPDGVWLGTGQLRTLWVVPKSASWRGREGMHS